MKNLRTLVLLMVFGLIGWAALAPQVLQAHCQIPCGIYDDHARVLALLEDAATIEKATQLIAELSGKTDPQSQNQLVRWVMNKETYAQEVISTICDYFLTQRVKPSQKDYTERLVKHHAVILAAVEAKQHADPQYARVLKERIEALLPYYPPAKL